MNPNNYRSHASTIQIYTKKSDSECLPPSVPVNTLCRSGDESKITPTTNTTNTNAAANTVGTNLRNRSSTKTLGSSAPNSNTQNVSSSALAQAKKDREQRRKTGSNLDESDEKPVYTIDSLTSEVESVQMEINEVLATASQSEAEFNSSESVLVAELEQLRERKKADDQQRSHIRSEAKSLEDSKRSLETSKTKVEKRYNQIEDELQKKLDRQKNWEQEVEQSKETIKEIDDSIAMEKNEAKRRIEELKGNISNCHTELSQFEEETRQLASESRKAESQKTATLKALDDARANTDKSTGIIDTESYKVIMANDLVDERLKNTLKSEVDIEKELEDDWQRIQKELEVRYLDVKEKYEEAYNAYYEALAKYDEELTNQANSSSATSSTNNVVLNTLNAATVNRSASAKHRSQTKKKHSKSMNMKSADSLRPQHQNTSGLSLNTNSNMNNNINNETQNETPRHSTDNNNSNSIMSPDVDRLLPSNLFATADEVRELPVANPANLFNTTNNNTSNEPRASGSILGNVLQPSTSQRTSSFGSGGSPKPSILSIRDQYNSNNEGTASPIMPSSPQGSFQNFPLFHRTGGSMTSNFTSPPPPPQSSLNDTNPGFASNNFNQEHQQKTSPPNTAKKLSSMFFFGRKHDHNNHNNSDTSNNPDSPENNNNIDTLFQQPDPGFNGEIGPIGSRRRTGSYSSSGSIPFGNGSSLFGGPWNNRETSSVNPADNNSLLLAPSYSNNGSTVSLESSKFGEVLNGSNRHLESSSLWMETNYHEQDDDEEDHTAQIPQLLVNDHDDQYGDNLMDENYGEIHDSGRSVDSKGSSGSGMNKFSKGFAGLFTSNNNSSNSPGEKMPISTEKSISSLFGKSSDEEDNRENILQKSMRSFSVRKSSGGSSSTTSSNHNGKFKVRSLSFFGSKKDHLMKEDNNEAIVEEAEGDKEIGEMDIKEFLADNRDTSDHETPRPQDSYESLI